MFWSSCQKLFINLVKKSFCIRNISWKGWEFSIESWGIKKGVKSSPVGWWGAQGGDPVFSDGCPGIHLIHSSRLGYVQGILEHLSASVQVLILLMITRPLHFRIWIIEHSLSCWNPLICLLCSLFKSYWIVSFEYLVKWSK